MDLSSIEISAGGLRAQRRRMDLIAANLANVDTTSVREEEARGSDGTSFVRHVPYRRKVAVLVQGPGGLPRVRVHEDPSPFRVVIQPGHPHAVPAGPGGEETGRVYFPNVDPMVEMVDLISASRAYEANLTAVEVAKAMNQSSLRILG